MRMKRQIIVNSETSNFKGEIEILNKNDKVAYVQWKIYDQENKLLVR